MYTIQNQQNIASVLNLGSLNVYSGGLLSGYLPANVSQLGSVFASGGMTLNVVNNVLNQGTITSPGALNIIAGGSIVNQAINNIQAVVSAQTALNIVSGSGSIVNSGLMSAINAINISTLSPDTNIVINNTGGIMEAISGTINIRDENFALKNDLTISGGQFLSQELNLYSGYGKIEVSVDNISGSVNGVAGVAYVGTNSPEMTLGNFALSSDPIFYNNSGGINITGAVSTKGGDLGIFANGDITIGAVGNPFIDTRLKNQPGGDVYIIAGATTSPGGGATGGTLNGATASASNGTYTVSLNGGGSILLTNGAGNATTTIITSGGNGNDDGGNVILLGVSNGASTANGLTGRVLLNGRMDTRAAGSGNNGNILIIAGAAPSTPGTVVQTGNILTDTAGSGNAGTFSVYTSQPVSSGGGSVDFVLSGAGGATITPSDTFVPTGGLSAPSLNSNAQVSTGLIQTNGQNVTILAGSNISTSGNIQTTKGGANGPGGSVILGSLTGNISINGGSGSIVTSNTGSTGSAGNVDVFAGGSISVGSITANARGAGVQNGGSISLFAGSGFNLSAGALSVPSGALETSGGGSIKTGNISSRGTGNGNGGSVTMIALQGTGAPLANSGKITAGTLNTGGAGTGGGGDIILIAADKDAALGTNQLQTSTIQTQGGGPGISGSVLLGATGLSLTSDMNVDLTTGAVSGGTPDVDLSAIRTGAISLRSIRTNGSTVGVYAGGNVNAAGGSSINVNSTKGSAGNIFVYSQSGSLSGNITSLTANAGVAGNGGNIALISGGTKNYTIPATVSATGAGAAGIGGDLTVLSGGNITIPTASTAANVRGPAQGGDITLVAGGAAGFSGTNLSVQGQSSTGGTFLYSGAGTYAINTSGTGANQAAGSLTILALEGSSAPGANSGVVNIPAAGPTMSINTRGAGAGANGNVLILASDVSSNATALSLGVNVDTGVVSGGTGGGGAITLAAAAPTTGGAITLNSRTGAVLGNTISVDYGDLRQGVSTRALSTRGAGVTVASGKTLSITGAVNSSAIGSGTGGDIVLRGSGAFTTTGAVTSVGAGAGSGGNIAIINNAGVTANTRIGGTISASGTGTGSGGSITLQYADSSAAGFVIGSAPAASGVNGDILASGAGGGNGGTITISNKLGSSLNVFLTSATATIAAAGASLGTVNFNVSAAGGPALNAASAVNVSGSAAGNGTITGNVNARGTSVTLNPRAAATTLTVNEAVGTAGAVSLTNNNGASSIVLLSTQALTVNAAGNITVDSPTIDNTAAAVVQSSTAGGSLTLQNSAVGGNLSLSGNGSYKFSTNNVSNTISLIAGSLGTGVISLSGSNTFDVGNATVAANSVSIQGSQVNLGNGTTQSISKNANVTFQPGSSSALSVNITGAGTASFAGSGTYTIGGNGAGNNVSLTAAATPAVLSLGGAVVVSTSGAGTFSVADGVTLNSNNKDVTVTTGSVNLNTSGALDAGSGLVILQPNAAGTTIGLNGGAGSFVVSGTSLGNITASTLQVGNNSSGSFAQSGTLDVSGAGPAGVYNLDFRSGGTYDGTGSTTTLGTKTLTINSAGVATIGTINGGGTTVSVTGSGVALGSTISLGAASTTNITASSGTISGTSVITSTTANLFATGDIGSVAPNQVRTNVTNLSAKSTGGDVYVRNTGAVNLSSGVANSIFDLTAGGALSTSISGVISSPNIYLTTTGANDITVDGNIGSGAGTAVKLNSGGSIIEAGGTVNSATLNLNASGDIGAAGVGKAIQSTGVTTLSGTSTNGGVYLLNSGSNINDFSASAGGASAVVLTTDGNVTLGGNVSGPAGVTLTTPSGGTLNDGGFLITANNSNIVLTSDAFNVSGSINAGLAGSLFISPATSNANINLSTFVPFASITAQNIQVGNNTTYTGSMSVGAGVLNTSSNLSFLSTLAGGGTFSNSGTINNGANNVTINVGGDISNAAGSSISGAAFDLRSGTGSIGGNVTNFNVSASSLTISAPNGNAFISNGAITPTVLNASSVSGDLLIGNQSALTANGVTSAGGNLTLLSNTSLSTNGTLTAGSAISFTGSNFVTNNASVTANGGDIFLLSTGAITNNSAFNATNGSFTANSAGAGINLSAGSTTQASNNVTLTANGDVNVGTASGAAVLVNAGQATTNAIALMGTGTIITDGAVRVIGNNVIIGDNTTLTSHGGSNAANTGDLTVTATGSVTVGKNNFITAYGGDMWFNAAGNISVDKGTQLISVGKLSDAGGTFTTISGAVVPNYFGGRVGLFAGSPVVNPTAYLQNMVNNRSGLNAFNIVGVAFNTSSANVSSTGGSTLEAINGNGLTMTIDPDLNNFYTLDGGVMSIRQAGAATIVFDPSLMSIGPTISPPPPTPPATSSSLITTTTPQSGINLSFAYLADLNSTNQGVPTDRINMQVPISGGQSILGASSLTVGDIRTWFVAEGPAQPFVLDGDDQTMIVGQEGTALAAVEARTVVLDQGKIAVLVGAKAELTVETRLGSVMIPSNGVVLVDSTDPRVIRVINLTSFSARVTLPNADKTLLSLPGGEELVLSETDADSVALAPHDGFTRSSLPISFKEGPVLIKRNAIDRRQVVQQERLLGCAEDRECMTKARVDALKIEVSAGKSGATGTPKSMRQALPRPLGLRKTGGDEGENLNPVAFSSTLGATATTMSRLSTMALGSATLKHRGADVEFVGDSIYLKRGEVLVHAEKPVVVRTPYGNVRVEAGALALISKDDLVTKVRNLWEPHSRCVRQYVGKHHVDVGVGQECVVSKDDKVINTIFRHDAIGRRRVQRFQLDAHKVSTSEISIITLMSSSPVLRAVTASSASEDLALKGKMLKMAACLQVATSGHGNYTGFGRQP